MGAGAHNSNKTSQLDMAQMTYFNNQVKRMKYANQKNGFKNKTKQTSNAINQVITKLRNDKLLDTSQMNNWRDKEKKGLKLSKSRSKEKQKQTKSKHVSKQTDGYLRNNRVKTKIDKNQKIVVNNNSLPGTDSQRKLYVGQIGKRYLNGQSKIKSQNKLLQYQSLNPNIQSYWNKNQVENIQEISI